MSEQASGDFSIGGTLWSGLSKLIEEAGEVQQVCGKIIGNEGRVKHWDGSHLGSRLTEELADLAAAIDFVMDYNGLDRQMFDSIRTEKARLFDKWHLDTIDARSAKL